MKAFRNTLIFLGVIALMFLMTIASLMRPDIPLERLLPDYTDATSAFLEIDGMRVHYRDEGSGPALLLIHGTFASLHTWDDWTVALRDSFRVVRIDLPGFGLTGPNPDNDYGTRSTLYLLESLRNHLGIERWSIAGNSLGGRYALDYARYYPEYTDKLIMLNAAVGRLPDVVIPDSNADSDAEGSSTDTALAQADPSLDNIPDNGSHDIGGTRDGSQADGQSTAQSDSNRITEAQPVRATAQDSQPLSLRMINHPRVRNLLTVLTPRAVIQLTLKEVYASDDLVDTDVVQRYFELLRREGNRAAFLTRNEGPTADRSHIPALPANPRPVTDLQLPVLIMWGEKDSWIRVGLGRTLHERMAGSELIVYENAGHVPMEEIPAETAADAMRFLLRASD